MNPHKTHVRAKTSVHSKRHSKNLLLSPKVSKQTYGEIKNFHTIDLENQDYNPALEEKTQRELKAVEDLCALSEEDATFMSFDHEFDRLWAPSEKVKKNNNNNLNQGNRGLSSRGYEVSPPPLATSNRFHQRNESTPDPNTSGTKWNYMKKGDGAKKAKGEKPGIPRMELGKVRILRDFIKENALSNSKRGYSKEQETLIKDQIERLLSSRNSERTPIPHYPHQQAPSFTKVKDLKESPAREGKEVLEIKNFVIEGDNENNCRVLNSQEIPNPSQEGANFRESFFKLFKGKQYSDCIEPELTVSQRRNLPNGSGNIHVSGYKIKRNDSKKTESRVSRVPTSQAVSRIVSRHDSLEAPVECEKPENGIFKEIGYDRLNKSTGFGMLKKDKKDSIRVRESLEMRREMYGIGAEDQGENELQAKVVQQSIQRIQIRSKWSSYLTKLKAEDENFDGIITSLRSQGHEAVEEKERKHRTAYKLQQSEMPKVNIPVPESPSETMNNITTTMWSPRIKEGSETTVTNVMVNLREIKNLKRLNLQSLGKKEEGYSPYKTMNAWPKDMFHGRKGSNLRDASPFGNIAHVSSRPGTNVTKERPFSALNIHSPQNKQEQMTTATLSYSRELRGLSEKKKEDIEEKITNNLLKKLISDSSQKRLNHKRSQDKLLKSSDAYSKLSETTSRISSRREKDYSNIIRVQHRYIKNAMQRNAIGSGQVKEVAAPLAIVVQTGGRVTASRMSRSKEMPFLEAIGHKVKDK